MITAAARPDPATSPITTPSWPDDRVNTSYQSRLSPPPAATVPRRSRRAYSGTQGCARLRCRFRPRRPGKRPGRWRKRPYVAVGAPAIATDPPLAMLSDGVLERTRRHYHDRFDGGRDSRG